MLIVQVHNKAKKRKKSWSIRQKNNFSLRWYMWPTLIYAMAPFGLWMIYQKECGVVQQKLIPNCWRSVSVLCYTYQKASTLYCDAYFGYLFCYFMWFILEANVQKIFLLSDNKGRSELFCIYRVKRRLNYFLLSFMLLATAHNTNRE